MDLSPAAVSGAGWLSGAGELAMTADDLARWDISLMNRSLLAEASYRALETETLLSSGVGTRYGLGVDVEPETQRPKIAHGGEVSGFTAESRVYPDDRAALARNAPFSTGCSKVASTAACSRPTPISISRTWRSPTSRRVSRRPARPRSSSRRGAGSAAA